jgi:hypothetical protein
MKGKCKEIVFITDGPGKGEPVECGTQLEQMEVEKPFPPFDPEHNRGVAEDSKWTIIYCPSCHTGSLRG